jgi:chromosome segregation ATPase
MFVSICIFCWASATAQEIPELQQQVVQEQLKMQQAEKASSFWQSQTETQTAQLHDALSHEKATALGSASLTACLRTRDVVQMEMQKLQMKQDDLSQKASYEKSLASKVNETMHSGLAECEARLEVTLKNTSVAVHNLQDAQKNIQQEHDDFKASVDAAQSEQQQLRDQVAAKDEEFRKEIEAAKLDQARKVANLKKQHAKVMEAHNMLKKAHEALQKQHDEMQKVEEKQKAQRSQEASQKDAMKEQLQQCNEYLKNSTDSQNLLRSSEKDMHQAAHSEGAKQSSEKWNEMIKNMTTQNAALQSQVDGLQNTAEQLQQSANNVEKDVPELQAKLRQCRASREKTELETQKALEHCPKKDSFLQLQQMQWP